MPNVSAAALLREIAAVPASANDVRRRFRQDAIALVARETLIEPALTFRIVDLEQPPGDVLRAGGETLYAPKLLPASGRLTALACGVATIGARLEGRITTLFAERSVSLALALEELGNELLLAVSRRLQDRMLVAARRAGLSLAGELRPGDPGLALNAHGPLLRLADAGSIGVSVTRGHVLQPLKSTSMVFGAGIDLPPARWSRCDDCKTRSSCKLAMRPAELADA